MLRVLLIAALATLSSALVVTPATRFPSAVARTVEPKAPVSYTHLTLPTICSV